jgi:hypothetical protein
MAASYGRVIAQLAESDEGVPAELIDLINTNIQPPEKISATDVYIRAMYVVSDQVNSFGGRFPIDEHASVARLLVDSPVLVGHRKDKLPVGRNFHATTVERDHHPWVKSYFYWLRSSDGAEQLKDNIDGGIYKECSVAFTFQLPECSICGNDIRKCTHQLFETYDRNGVAEKCCFNYRRIEKVLETSLVYRGAVPDTLVSKDLTATDRERLVSLDDLSRLPSSDRYLIVPHYDGLPLVATVSNDRLMMTALDGTSLEITEREYQPRGFRPDVPVYGVLVGYRGKERCSRGQLHDHMCGRESEVSRLVFNVFPQQGILALPLLKTKSRLNVQIIPHRLTEYEDIDRAAREIMTRDGVEIWPEHQVTRLTYSGESAGYLYCPNHLPGRSAQKCEIMQAGDRAFLTIGSGSGIRTHTRPSLVFELFTFGPAALNEGCRFVARRETNAPPAVNRDTLMSDQLQRFEKTAEAYSFECAGAMKGSFVLRPIRLRGEDCYLFYQIKANAGGQAR